MDVLFRKRQTNLPVTYIYLSDLNVRVFEYFEKGFLACAEE